MSVRRSSFRLKPASSSVSRNAVLVWAPSKRINSRSSDLIKYTRACKIKIKEVTMSEAPNHTFAIHKISELPYNVHWPFFYRKMKISNQMLNCMISYRDQGSTEGVGTKQVGFQLIIIIKDGYEYRLPNRLKCSLVEDQWVLIQTEWNLIIKNT